MFQFKILIALLAASSSFAQDADPGPLCPLKVDVTCTLDDGTDCDELLNKIHSDCRKQDVRYDFKMCSRLDLIGMNQSIVFKQEKTETKIMSVVQDMDKTSLASGDCREFTRFAEVDTCNRRFLKGSIKLEGWVFGFTGVDDYYCYGYKHITIPLATRNPTRQPTPLPSPVPTSSPTPVPTPVSTPAPTKDIGGNQLPTAPLATDLELECEYVTPSNPSAGTKECANLSSEIFTSSADCVKTLTYTYKAFSDNPVEPAQLQGLVISEGSTQLQSLAAAQGVSIPANGVKDFENVVVVNYCTDFESRSASGVAVFVHEEKKSTDPDYTETEEAKYTVPAADVSGGVTLDMDTSCVIAGTYQSCSDYMKAITSASECFTDVIFKYDVENIGFACAVVDVATGTVDNEERLLSLDTNACGAGRKLCPGDEWTVEDPRRINLCDDLSGQSIDFALDLDDFTATDNILFPVVNLPTATDPPVSTPVASPVSAPRVECSSRPSEMSFRFTERYCSDSDNSFGRRVLGENDKRRTKSNYSYFTCEDGCEFTDPVNIKITSSNYDDEVYFEGDVNVGDGFTARSGGSFSSNIDVTITATSGKNAGKVAQTFTLHSSCSKPIFNGDTFGALELLGWKNSYQNVGPSF